ncbi:hypothetical protein THIOM_002480 [Candidatus Thiomargarita nelsonii]|uniref:Uncharacterized protein n=1 Tax=Candidatus Thiomargarita nelsonii TaxID=1003181 RepID=A0A176S1D9_9GAMM|nr:hypothetical protein THIOM_002480 [Candidatus Thiomargarita nelsonii]
MRPHDSNITRRITKMILLLIRLIMLLINNKNTWTSQRRPNSRTSTYYNRSDTIAG